MKTLTKQQGASLVSQYVLIRKVRNYLKTNNISLKLRLVKGLFVIDNVHTRFLGSCADLCECATGVKFEAIGLTIARPL